ncbi:MAG: zinc-dependent metalloprotease, partial [Pirellula sp.]
IQSSALTMLMNPTTLRRVYDNELLVPKDQDALTLPEMLEKVQTEVWSELGANPEGEVSARKPRISSWRRNLQREYLDRLIDLAVPGTSGNKAITSLALMQLKEVKKKVDAVLAGGTPMDPYSAAHLTVANCESPKPSMRSTSTIHRKPVVVEWVRSSSAMLFQGLSTLQRYKRQKHLSKFPSIQHL